MGKVLFGKQGTRRRTLVILAGVGLTLLWWGLNTCEGSSLGDLGRAYYRQAFQELPGMPYVAPNYESHEFRETITTDTPAAAPGAPRVIETHEYRDSYTAPSFNPFTSPPATIPERLLYPEKRFYFDENGMLKMR